MGRTSACGLPRWACMPTNGLTGARMAALYPQAVKHDHLMFMPRPRRLTEV